MFEITVPTGATFNMHALKVKDTDRLLSSSKKNLIPTLFSVMDSCTEEVLDYGIYDDSTPFSWKNAFEGDWFYALIQLRMHTFGSEYEVRLKCPSCGSVFSEVVDLNELYVQKPEDYVLKALQSDRKVTVNVYDIDADIVIRFLTGNDNIKQERDRNLRQSKNLLENAFRSRVVEVNGEIDRGKNMQWFKELSALEGQYIFDAINNVEFGVELETEFTCPICDYEFYTDLPLKENFFTMVKTHKKKH